MLTPTYAGVEVVLNRPDVRRRRDGELRRTDRLFDVGRQVVVVDGLDETIEALVVCRRHRVRRLQASLRVDPGHESSLAGS